MIILKVSKIKRTWLRRVVMVVTLPLCVLFAIAQAIIFGLVVIVCEPIRRTLEICFVMADMVPSFKKQWRAAPASPSKEGS